jgi:hypothetical protein
MSLEIDISIQAANLVLNQNAGNLRAIAGTDITWKTRDPKRHFTLEFFTLTIGGEDSPFTCGRTIAEVTAEKPFTGQLRDRLPKGDVGAYKYSVTCGSLVLDPVIIMGDE